MVNKKNVENYPEKQSLNKALINLLTDTQAMFKTLAI